jgi:diguanylate cyclase (GGDEF)-like protein
MTEINTIAYQDALTHVGNKAAYDKMAETLDNEILNKKAQFAIVMSDLNHLKSINDRFGHDKGNEYIIGSCRLICDVFTHSPVYRVGGDEFVVILQNRDYRNRDSLLEIVRSEFREASMRNETEPWLQYSAAFGMAVYDTQNDTDVDSVFKRADDRMYNEKIKTRK